MNIYFESVNNQKLFPLPKCHLTKKKKEKSCFIDSNKIYTYNVKRNLGDFDYESLKKDN